MKPQHNRLGEQNIGAEVFETTIHVVKGNSDNTEGRGHTVILGRFFEHREAKKAAKGRGVMGAEAAIDAETVKVVRIGNVGDDKFFLLGDQIETDFEDREAIKEAALSKLTDKEKEILGLER